MVIYSHDIVCLEMESERKQAAFIANVQVDIFSMLAEYDPFLVGTLPLAIDLAHSERNFICFAAGHSDTPVR